METFELLRRWSDYLEVRGDSPVTRHQYRRYLVQFLSDVLIPLDEVTEDDIVGYLATLPAKGASRGQILKSIRCFYAWATPRLEIADPALRLRVKKTKPPTVRALSPEDFAALLEAAEQIDPRARPTMELMYATGARLGTICALMPEDVEFGEGIVRFRVMKGGKTSEKPLGPRAAAAAQDLISLIDYVPKTVRTRRPTLVGVGEGRVWQWVHMAAALAGVDASPHALRRTFGTTLANDPNVSLGVWVDAMDHEDATQFNRYVKKDAVRLSAALAKL